MKDWYVTLTQFENETIRNSNEIIIYTAIKSYCSNGRREFDISTRDIQSRTFLSLGTILKYLPRMVEKKYISVVGSKSRIGGHVPIYKCLLTVDTKDLSDPNFDKSVQPLASKTAKYKNIKTYKNDIISSSLQDEFADEVFAKFPASEKDKP